MENNSQQKVSIDHRTHMVKTISFVVLIIVCLDSLAILLKLLGFFPGASWGWILAPLWGPLAFSLIVLVVGGIFVLAVKVLLLASGWLASLAKGLKQ